ncbi:MAG: protein translocase subunit SecF, partial [Pseudomonadales bacterium]|nr:protein translocase subunit SecF [Pseudomonadales bacterium]
MKTPNISFMSYRKIALIMSIIVFVLSIASLATRGLNYGLDFTGGTQVEVAYEKAADVDMLRDHLDASGFDGASVQHFGKPTEVLVRIQPKEGEDSSKLGDRVFAALEKQDENVEKKRIEYVGPQVGEELRDQSGSAMIFALILMLIYVTLRFRFKFAVGAVIALFHDVIIVLGFFSITQMDFDLTVLAAVLAVIGYSLNDTIVVSDRIRENFRT